MSLLVQFTINGTVRYLSQEGVDLERYYENLIISFDAPQFSLDQDYGGYCRLTYGEIVFSPELFENDYPPPRDGAINVKWTDTDEASAITFFEGTAYLREISKDQIAYDLYGDNLAINILETITDYNGNTVPIPRALGFVKYAPCLRLPDNLTFPVYHKSYITGTIVGVDYNVYDDGVNINSNVTDGGSTFQLSAVPVGEVTIEGTAKYGTAQDDTVLSIVEEFTGASWLNLTFDSTNARSPSPSVSYWLTSQDTVTGMLSQVTAFFTHLFYIQEGTLYLLDMLIDNGDRSIDDFDYFTAPLEYETPARLFDTEWSERQAVNDRTGWHVIEIPNNISVDGSYSYGEIFTVSPSLYSWAGLGLNQTANVNALNNIKLVMEKTRANVEIPLEGDLPVPGEAINWTDVMMVQGSTGMIRTRNITYDFDTNTIAVEGEGSVSLTP